MTLVDSQQGSGELSPLTELGQKPDVFGRQFFPEISENSVKQPTPGYRAQETRVGLLTHPKRELIYLRCFKPQLVANLF